MYINYFWRQSMHVRELKRKHRHLIIILSIFLAILLFFSACNFKVTKANYEKIHNGMTYEEVIDILGDDYEVSSSAGFGGSSASCYIWENGDRCITIIFVNGRVYSKAQSGL